MMSLWVMIRGRRSGGNKFGLFIRILWYERIRQIAAAFVRRLITVIVVFFFGWSCLCCRRRGRCVEGERETVVGWRGDWEVDEWRVRDIGRSSTSSSSWWTAGYFLLLLLLLAHLTRWDFISAAPTWFTAASTCLQWVDCWFELAHLTRCCFIVRLWLVFCKSFNKFFFN